MDYGQIIKEERKRQGISRRKLAELTDLSISTIWYCEQSGNTTFISTMDKILDALGISLIIGRRKNNEYV